MSPLRLRVGLILYGIGLLTVILVNLFFPSATVAPDGLGYRVTDSFERVSINNRVLTASAFRFIPGESIAALRQRIRQSFKPNRYVYAIQHGHSSDVPTAWVYFTLTNTTATPKDLVLSMPPYRCSRVTLFLERVGPSKAHRPSVARPSVAPLDSVATRLNNTPLLERDFPCYLHTFSLTLAPGQTTTVLLRTNTYLGYHELDLKLSNRQAFQRDMIRDILWEGTVMLCCLLIGLVSIGVGLATPSRLMTTYGVLMFMIMLLFAFIFGYLSALPYPQSTSFNSLTIGTTVKQILDIVIHFFFYESIKPIVRTVRWYRPAMWAIIAIASSCILIHLLPPALYPYVNVPVNRVMHSMSIVNLVWIGYFSLVAYRRAGIVSIGMFFLVFVGEIVVKQLTELVLGNQPSLLKFPMPNPLLLIGMLTFLTASQFQRELVTKRRMKKRVRQVQGDINALRREEVARIGRDLHDQVGNTLAAALGYLDNGPNAPSKSEPLIRNAIAELRFLSHNLVKDDNRPLTEKVATLIDRFNDFSKTRFFFDNHAGTKMDQLPLVQQQSVYHIVQELFTNIVRHSGASRVYVQFFANDQTLEVAVEDNGTGFDLATARANGVGLQNMYKRAELAQFTLHFDSTPTGTSVYLTIHPDETVPNHSD